MPELPEVQTVVHSLQPTLPGKIIKLVHCPNGYTGVLENGSIKKYQNFLIGKILQSVYRRGKFIIIKLDYGFLLIHLRMTGKVVLEKPLIKEMKYVSFQLTFSDNTKLYFQDVRKFGRVYICHNLNWLETQLGIEPLSNDFTPIWLYELLHKHKRMIKPLLMDQQFIAGLGNIYIDEALWQSGIHPRAISNKIGKIRSNKLSTSIKDILKRAISYQGTTIINFSYGQNKNGNFSDELQIFGKTNSPCPKCSKPIIKIFVAQRGTHFCKQCQKF